jgi:hypothetical protein
MLEGALERGIYGNVVSVAGFAARNVDGPAREVHVLPCQSVLMRETEPGV